MKILCLIPAYNEKGNLTELVKKLSFQLSKIGLQYELLFIIQGTDGSFNLMKKLEKYYKQIHFLYFPKPLGIGTAYQVGFAQIDKTTTHILTLDADLNHDPVLISQFLQALNKEHADIIIGSRFMKGGQFQDRRIWKRVISFIINILITKLFKIDVHDITSGYRLMKKNVVTAIYKDLKESGYPSYMELILQAKIHGFIIKEIPIKYIPRRWGKSKMNKIKTFFDYLFFFIRILSAFAEDHGSKPVDECDLADTLSDPPVGGESKSNASADFARRRI